GREAHSQEGYHLDGPEQSPFGTDGIGDGKTTCHSAQDGCHGGCHLNRGIGDNSKVGIVHIFLLLDVGHRHGVGGQGHTFCNHCQQNHQQFEQCFLVHSFLPFFLCKKLL